MLDYFLSIFLMYELIATNFLLRTAFILSQRPGHCETCEDGSCPQLMWPCQLKAALVNTGLATGEPHFGQFPDRGQGYYEMCLLTQILLIKRKKRPMRSNASVLGYFCKRMSFLSKASQLYNLMITKVILDTNAHKYSPTYSVFVTYVELHKL